MSEENSQNRQAKICLIDDDEVASTFGSHQLRKSGYEIHCIHDPTEALPWLDSNPVHAVLLDIKMPKMDGFEVLEAIRKKHNQIECPVLMLTASDDDSDIIKAIRLGANDYLTKPLKLEIANARIDAHLNIAGMAKKEARLKQIETIQAMIATYNHEINNPLAVAMGFVSTIKQTEDEAKLIKVKEALQRIKVIMGKIRDLSHQHETDFEKYSGSTKMVSLK